MNSSSGTFAGGVCARPAGGGGCPCWPAGCAAAPLAHTSAAAAHNTAVARSSTPRPSRELGPLNGHSPYAEGSEPAVLSAQA